MEKRKIRNELSDVMLGVMSGGLSVERVKDGLDKALLLASELGESVAFSVAWKKVG